MSMLHIAITDWRYAGLATMVSVLPLAASMKREAAR